MKNYGRYSDNKDISTKGHDVTAVSFPTINNTTNRNIQLTLGNGNSLTCIIPEWNQSTTGNAATATKLRTAVTLWGRSFDGSANVTGALTNTGSITPEANEAYNLGNSTKRFANIFGKNGDFSNTMSVAGATALGSTLSVTGATTLSSTLSVSGNTEMNSVLNITGITGYAQGIRIHPYSGTSSIWFGATNLTGFDAGMWGITVDTSSSATSFRIRGTDTYDSTTPVDYIKILNGGKVRFNYYVGINADASTSYRLYVNGDSYLKGKTYIGSTTYYLYGTSGWSYLPVLNLGGVMGSSSTHKLYVNGTSYFTGAITVGSSATFTGDTSVTSTTPLSVASTIANTTAAFKVSGGAAIGGSLSVLGKRIYLGYHNNTSYYIELDGNGYLHTNAGFYSDSWIASGGVGSAGGSGSGVNVNSYAQIQAGSAAGVVSEDLSYVPTSYALRKVYEDVSGIIGGTKTLTSFTVRSAITLTNNSYNVSAVSLDSQGAFNVGDVYRNTYIRGSHVYINENEIGTAAYKTSETSLTNNSSKVPTSSLLYKYVNGTSAFSYILISKSSGDPKITLRGTYDGTQKSIDVFYNGSQFEIGGDLKVANIIGTGALKYTYNGVTSDVLSLNSNGLLFGVTTTATTIQGSSVTVSGATTFSNAITIDSNTIGGYDHLVFNRNSVNYIRASHTDGSFIFITNGKSVSTSNSSLRINQYGISIKTSTAPSSSYALRVNGNSILSGTLTVGGYYVKGKKEYDLTSLFTKNSGTAIDTIGDSSVEGFLNDICNGNATLFTTEQKTFNSTAFSPRFDVHVAYMQSNFFALYYARMGGTPPMYFEVIEITYNSGWKISTRKTVTLN